MPLLPLANLRTVVPTCDGVLTSLRQFAIPFVCAVRRLLRLTKARRRVSIACSFCATMDSSSPVEHLGRGLNGGDGSYLAGIQLKPTSSSLPESPAWSSEHVIIHHYATSELNHCLDTETRSYILRHERCYNLENQVTSNIRISPQIWRYL
ncbi:hypothetical protein BU26DRAFT_295325 [Trematosphaeria pertusa]|uniref:Uncharacterized protein n=1 Tax=Trematosphaeria pertusa TaxID=390896 RepID=A0A6A6IKK4_9PLEO|nr:uncharacterized protein BU26DRAFT_295325 [Trematosphaeria pertusa]KAF2250090.1 hypothetical protein BU26DRAFT_295325 [Trematosphaeria pertusa]